MAGGRDVLNDYPVQPAKVQRPPLRDETLARERLLDWLGAKVHHRVVFVIAEAGYGKTTLLADFSRRTRVRTLWYRLDEEDRNWIAFISYLVAAGREHDEGFAPITAGMLREIGPSGPSRQAIVETLIRELRSLGEHGAVVILDDFHVVDDEPEIRDIVGELIARAPERVSFVILSRRMPSVRVARLRALGEVAELATDDLRFNGVETERLFRETYGQPLEGDVLQDLSQRTEGWAASLQLVQAAIRDRTPTETRRFIRSLSGAEGDLYDYLAEEVVGDLPEELQDFLMKVSILQSLGGSGPQDVSGLDEKATTSLLSQAERVGLVGRPHRGSTGRRFHPLVRQFLTDRLRRDVGDDGVRALHLRVAEASGESDWQIAAHHLASAGETSRLGRLLEAHLPSIVAADQYAEASGFVALLGPQDRLPALGIVPSRVALQRGDFDDAEQHALKAVNGPASEELTALAIANLLALRLNQGDVTGTRLTAKRLLATSPASPLAAIAKASIALMDASSGPVRPALRLLERMADAQRQAGQYRYLGVTMVNLAQTYALIGDWRAVRKLANEAIESLENKSSLMELANAYTHRAWSHAHEGNWALAADDLSTALAIDTGSWKSETLANASSIIAMYGDPLEAVRLTDEMDIEALPERVRVAAILPRIRALAQTGRTSDAARLVETIPAHESTAIGFQSIYATTIAVVAALAGQSNAQALADAAVTAGFVQGAQFWRKGASVIAAASGPDSEFASRIDPLLPEGLVYISAFCELVVPRLGLVGPEVLDSIAREVNLRPQRWRGALRREIAKDDSRAVVPAAVLLEAVGEGSDVALLRAASRRNRRVAAMGGAGRSLARRRATCVFIEDLGRIAIRNGETTTIGSSIRRKVLSLLGILLAQPGSSTTRDFIMDSLWPDLDPTAALNSLNQTVYFLRRVIEPAYDEDTSPGYVHHDGELVWLDPDLVESRSGQCRSIIRRLSGEPNPLDVDALSEAYIGRFALDFEYEEWAVPYREWLHAAYLEIIEQAVREDSRATRFGRAIALARRALEVDPHAEQLELLLLRSYRMSGAHAAAAEQYEHYASVLRNELGVEPPPLDAL